MRSSIARSSGAAKAGAFSPRSRGCWVMSSSRTSGITPPPMREGMDRRR
jgi:hypothetical protein